jgi:cobalamin biosynthesis Mg chelatase CobN
MLALLAMACFPISAQAEESSGAQYNPVVPSVPGKTKPPSNSDGGSPATASSGAPNGSADAGAVGTGSSGGSSADNPSTGGGGGTGEGSSGKGSTAGNDAAGKQRPVGSLETAVPIGGETSSDDSSSPLVPILIAIAALAAISIGAVVIRQRRQRDAAGAPVSPKAS